VRYAADHIRGFAYHPLQALKGDRGNSVPPAWAGLFLRLPRSFPGGGIRPRVVEREYPKPNI
jgi:hypothetical protein